MGMNSIHRPEIAIWWAYKNYGWLCQFILFNRLLHGDSYIDYYYILLIKHCLYMCCWMVYVGCASWFLIFVYVIFHSLNNTEQIVHWKTCRILYGYVCVGLIFSPLLSSFLSCTIKIDHKWLIHVKKPKFFWNAFLYCCSLRL